MLVIGAALFFFQDRDLKADRKVPTSPPADKTELGKLREADLDRGKTTAQKLDSLFTRANKRLGFHGSVLIAQEGKLIFHDQYGLADFQTQTALTDTHAFQLASLSKQFTAAAVLLLVEEKMIYLDDTIGLYFPNFPYPNITLRHLLHHTSGLPKYFWLVENKWPTDTAPTNKQVVELMYKEVVNYFFPPNSNFDYSNTGYFILSAIVEKVTGEPFSEFLHTHIFDPCDMQHSYVFRYGIDTVRADQLMGYRLYRRYRYYEVPFTINDAVTGDKNVYSTALDLFKWYTALENGFLLSPKSYEMMKTPGKNKYGRTLEYGMGLRIEEENGETKVYHNGKWNGFRNSYTTYPESNTLIIVLEHSNSSSVVPLVKAAYNIVKPIDKRS